MNTRTRRKAHGTNLTLSDLLLQRVQRFSVLLLHVDGGVHSLFEALQRSVAVGSHLAQLLVHVLPHVLDRLFRRLLLVF